MDLKKVQKKRRLFQWLLFSGSCIASLSFGYYGLAWLPVVIYIALAMLLAFVNAIFAIRIAVTSEIKWLASTIAALGFIGGQFFLVRIVFVFVAWSVHGFAP